MATPHTYPNPDNPEFTFTSTDDIPKVIAAIALCDQWCTYNYGRWAEDHVGTPDTDRIHFEILLEVLQQLKKYEDKFGKL
jgi:hypothetical protein